ncbi:tyrosine-type recombinase/integrase [Citreicella sp. C3M06]|uniref:tyrosine-type recombinase/integrase n=1 Tax=Citreicella sp. C3M06 TaxID=2841564 RepID=UPI001C090B98|nr:tyrosine-type recombinase/integrase [Citreicella sp. C3M06]MBU2963050.1 tyrosine-type recombinase/integrase [Citreicella sp. C3M06]
MSLLFPLRSHVMRDAKVLAQKLTLLSDIAFAGVTERTMAIAPDIMEKLLVELCRFLIEAADVAREMAPARTPEAAAYELACANAAVETLRHAIAIRDRERARNPLREVADRLGIALDESDPDWQRLAFRALRVMLEAEEENARRDRGEFQGPSAALQAARPLVDGTVPISSAPTPATFSPAPRPNPVALPAVPSAHNGAATCRTAAPVTRPGAPASAPTAAPAHDRIAAVPPASEPSRNCNPCPKITEATELYVEARSRGYKSFKPTEQADETAGANWARNSGPNVKSTGLLLSRIVGNKSVDDITDAELKMIWELLARLPKNYQAKTSKQSPQEAVDDADATERRNHGLTRARLEKKGASPGKIESELLKDRIPRLRPATIYRHMQDAQRICKFLVKKGQLLTNIMADHIWEKAEYERREILQEDNERQTWCGKLKGLFRTPIFQGKLDDVGDPMFWAPLIAVHMGLRSEEVLQLYIDDIQVIDDIPCIVLKKGPGQSLKSKASRRTIPIHDNLLKLGLMQLVAFRRREEEPRLFPWLERSQSKKTYTETFSKRFTRYRQDHNIYDAQRDFYSFRTTFNHFLIQTERQDSHRRALMGHVERDVGITNYNPSGFSMKTLRDCVNAVEIDISMIRSPFAEVNSARVMDLAAHRTKTTA